MTPTVFLWKCKLQAERLFSELRRLEAYHLEGLEFFSTTLWHLHREVALSTLAQELSNFEPESPEVRA